MLEYQGLWGGVAQRLGPSEEVMFLWEFRPCVELGTNVRSGPGNGCTDRDLRVRDCPGIEPEVLGEVRAQVVALRLEGLRGAAQ